MSVTVAACGAVFLVGFPLGLVDKIYAGYQEGYVSNYWSMATNVLTVAASNATITSVDAALQQIDSTGAQLGAYQARFPVSE